MAKAAKTASAEAEAETNADAPKASQPKSVPSKIKMVQPHGFIDEETGTKRHWQQDQVVFEPADIALLMERGANFVVVE